MMKREWGTAGNLAQSSVAHGLFLWDSSGNVGQIFLPPSQVQGLLGFPGGSDSKESPVMQETSVPPLGWEDPLEKAMATHSSILAWEIPWTEEPGGLESMGSQRVRHNCATFTQRGLSCWVITTGLIVRTRHVSDALFE